MDMNYESQLIRNAIWQARHKLDTEFIQLDQIHASLLVRCVVIWMLLKPLNVVPLQSVNTRPPLVVLWMAAARTIYKETWPLYLSKTTFYYSSIVDVGLLFGGDQFLHRCRFTYICFINLAIVSYFGKQRTLNKA